MTRIPIQLYSYEEIKSFVKVINQIEGSADLCRNNYRVDAKSFMGVLTLQGAQADLEIFEESREDLLNQISCFGPERASA